MKASSLLSALTLLLQSVSGHYVFSRFLVNNTETTEWQYVRNLSTALDPYDQRLPPDIKNPMLDLRSENIRCGRGGTITGITTDIATVVAGEEVGFRVGYSPSGIFHDGPKTAFLSKAPGDLKAYQGEGDWFKIAQVGPASKTRWQEGAMPTEYNFTIPSTTPPGDYLLRMEQFWPKDTFNSTQFYVACAQIRIVGDGGGNPGPFTRFPGAYDNFDPSIWVTYDIYAGIDLSKYQMPAPQVWVG